MSFELVAAAENKNKRSRPNEDDDRLNEDIFVSHDDVIKCAGLLADVKLTFDLPDHAKYQQASEVLRAYGNELKIREEADEFFWKNHIYSFWTGTCQSYSVTLTLVRILLDWDYKYYDLKTNVVKPFTHDDRVRLFRILWDKKIDNIPDDRHRFKSEIGNADVHRHFITGEEKSYITYDPKKNVYEGVTDFFQKMLFYQNIETRGEEILFRRIKDFDSKYLWEINNTKDPESGLREGSRYEQLIGSIIEPTEPGGDLLDPLPREPTSFCDLLFCALTYADDERVKKITRSVIAVLSEKAYLPDWVRKDGNFSRIITSTSNPKPPKKVSPLSPDYVDYLKRLTAYRRSPLQKRPEWVGGEFFEREIFFHDLERKEYTVGEMRQKFNERYEFYSSVDLDFFIQQGVLQPPPQ